MPARKSIRALGDAQSNGRRISSGEPPPQQQPPETLFHGHNLRSRRLPSSDAQQIPRKDQTVVQEDPQKKCEQAGTSRKNR